MDPPPGAVTSLAISIANLPACVAFPQITMFVHLKVCAYIQASKSETLARIRHGSHSDVSSSACGTQVRHLDYSSVTMGAIAVDSATHHAARVNRACFYGIPPQC